MFRSIPPSALALPAGTPITGARGFTALWEDSRGVLMQLDEVLLGSTLAPGSSVTLGLASAGTPESVFDAPAALSGGIFSGTLDASSLPAGDYDVWARACLGQVCGSASAPLTRGG